ncbi:MAG: ubiquinone/menaquinone biosynthesis methyltransferase [Anaerolineaceae bacterium]|nr:ubiquinone/menaquinone biosynthesis methyltransferase [Anaerolineaceae bacterium]
MMKTLPEPSQKARYVKDVFRRIAPRYDLMNKLMTGGFDVLWKKRVVKLAEISAGQTYLDLGAGTGDLARRVKAKLPDLKMVAADYSFYMMLSGREKGNLPFVNADAMFSPFASRSFDRITSGYLLRNVADIDRTIAEIYRLLKPGGKYVDLDTTQPRKNILSPFIHFHMHHVIPFVGGLLSGSRDAYEYLPDSSEKFLTAEALAERLRDAGFTDVTFTRYMFGTVAIHSATKPK